MTVTVSHQTSLATRRIKRKASFARFGMCSAMLLLLYHAGFRAPSVNVTSTVSNKEDVEEPTGVGVANASNKEEAEEGPKGVAIATVDMVYPGSSARITDDLDSSRRVPCGSYKCFFPSKSNHQVGYLVSRSASHFVDARLKMLYSGWHLAKELESTYGINNFLSMPPINVTVSSDLAIRLNQNLWSEKNDESMDKQFFREGKPVYIQTSRVAPQPSLLIGCDKYKSKNFIQYLEEFLMSVKDKATFARTLGAELTKTRALLDHEPCLYYDFQILVGTEGQIYHFDFDRCYHSSSGTKKRNISRDATDTIACRKTLDEIESQIYGAIEGSTTTSFDSVQLQDMNSSTRVPCGHYKCFFPSKSDSQLGYLVSRTPSHHPDEWISRLQSGWHLAKELERKYGIKNFLRSPPTNMTVSGDLATRLNENLWSEKDEKPMRRNFFGEGRPIYIQASRIAPVPHLLIGCDEYKSKNFVTYLETFLASVEDRASFARNLRADMTKTRELLVHEPCLLYDFQVLVDTKGRIYHIDIDRAFTNAIGTPKRNVSKHTSDKCFQTVDEIERQIYQAVEGNKDSSA